MNSTYNVIVPECEKINHHPLVLKYSFFKIADSESNIKGYWLDGGKLYVDNIQKVNISLIHKDYLQLLIDAAFRSGERAVFYKDTRNRGIILYSNGDKLTLCNQLHIIEDNRPTDTYIMALCRQHGGCTVYTLDNGQFLIEIYGG